MWACSSLPLAFELNKKEMCCVLQSASHTLNVIFKLLNSDGYIIHPNWDTFADERGSKQVSDNSASIFIPLFIHLRSLFLFCVFCSKCSISYPKRI